jgi:hypothetical protein
MPDINTTQMRDALAWATQDAATHEASSNPFVWFWEAVEGDFNENRTTAQILVDAGISMIPLVDQVCDVRDLIADCKKLVRDPGDTWAWIALVLTLIGLFPTLGSLVKGVLKIFFAFVRRAGGESVKHSVNAGMTWVITFLRRREVQVFLNSKKVDEVFQWLSAEIKSLRQKINPAAITAAFDRGIKVLESLANRVALIPLLAKRAKDALEQVKTVRLMADKHVNNALRPVQDIVDTIILALERQILEKQNGIVNTTNIHFRGVIPEAQAVALMRKRKPAWLSISGEPVHSPVALARTRKRVDELSAKLHPDGTPRDVADQFPVLSDNSITSFHSIVPHVIRGPARLYRIVSPGSRGMSDCWVSREVFEQLQRAPDPKAAWRRYLAVWPDWNANGQFVIYEVKAGETLNTWKGLASSQERSPLPGHHLEGGWEQIVFNVPLGDARADTITYFKKTARNDLAPERSLTQSEVDTIIAKMNRQQKAIFFENHIGVRQKINHSSISGPFETGWGYSEFEGAGFSGRIGLPALPGQITTTKAP